MKIGNLKISVLRTFRFIIQIASWFFLPLLYVSVFKGVRGIYVGIVSGTFDLSTMLSALIPAIAVIPLTIIVGRFFCGWMCAFGSISSFAYSFRKKFFKSKFKVSETAHKYLKYVKYLVLVGTIIFIWQFDISKIPVPFVKNISPWDAFGILPDFGTALSLFSMSFFIFVIVFFASMFVERFFCRYLCPLGAIFEMTSVLRVVKINKPRSNCGKCKVCTMNCEMGIPLYKHDKISSGECIQCFKCVSVCPRKNANVSIASADIHPLIAGAMAVSSIAGVFYIGNFSANGVATAISTTGTTVVGQTHAVKMYVDGTYTGTGQGFRGNTIVSVTIKNDYITAVSVVSTDDDMQFFNDAFNAINPAIINTQSANVNVVAGSTYSSNGIMSAVSDALSKAVRTSATTATTINAAIDASTTSTTTEAVTTTTEVSTTTVVAKGTYKDGTYTGSGQGYHNGTTTIDVTISNGKITGITTVSTEDYPIEQYYDRVFSDIKAQIISAQSSNVNAISGATFSCYGIMSAVENALAKAV